MINVFDNVELSIEGRHLVTIPHWEIKAGEVYGLTGESGTGKSTIGKWLGGIEPVYWEVNDELLDPALLIQEGERDSAAAWPKQLPPLYLLQDAYQIFNPYVSILRHFKDIWKNCQSRSHFDSFEEVIDVVRSLDIPDPLSMMRRKVGGVSQGEAQRLAFALGLIRPAALRIYDEVFSNVDRSSSDKMLEVLQRYCNRSGTSAVVISHEVGLLHNSVSRIYSIEDKVVQPLKFKSNVPTAPITESFDTLLIHIEDLSVPGFGNHNDQKKLLWQSPIFCIGWSECVGISGSSGQGKTTFLRGLLGEHDLSWSRCTISNPRDEASNRLEDLDIRYLPQSVSSAFNPACHLRTSIDEITSVHGVSEEEVIELLTAFGLTDQQLDSYPSMLSGGEIQRLGVISVMLGQPDLVMLDESFSSVDDVTRDSIWSVVKKLQSEKEFAVLVVSHDTQWLQVKMNRVYEVG